MTDTRGKQQPRTARSQKSGRREKIIASLVLASLGTLAWVVVDLPNLLLMSYWPFRILIVWLTMAGFIFSLLLHLALEEPLDGGEER